MPAEFSDIRIAFIWAETVLDALKNSPRPGARLGFLSQRFSFAPVFEKARQQPVVVDEALGFSLQAPWPKPTGQRFWKAYFNKKSPAQISGDQAWEWFVPLRGKLPFAVTSSSATAFDVFFYPYGLALLATVRLVGKFSLQTAVEEAFKVRRDKIFTFSRPGRASEGLTLDSIAEHALTAMRDLGWGKDCEGQATALDPFSIFVFAQGSGVDPVGVSKVPGAHRALEAVTHWRPAWKTVPPDEKLRSLEQARISSHNSEEEAEAAGDAQSLVYGGPRGRALWFPDLLAQSPGGSTLSCYYRNLILGSLQVESLCGFAHEMAAQIAQKKALSFFERECTENAADVLSRLYGGSSTIYRSWSVRAQIEQNGFVPDINAIRVSLKKPALA